MKKLIESYNSWGAISNYTLLDYDGNMEYSIDMTYTTDYTIVNFFSQKDDIGLELFYDEDILILAKDNTNGKKYAHMELSEGKKTITYDQVVGGFTSLKEFLEDFKKEKYVYLKLAEPFSEFYSVHIYTDTFLKCYSIDIKDNNKQIYSYNETLLESNKMILKISNYSNMLHITRFVYNEHEREVSSVSYPFVGVISMDYFSNMYSLVCEFSVVDKAKFSYEKYKILDNRESTYKEVKIVETTWKKDKNE